MNPNPEQIIMHKIKTISNLYLTTIKFILEETSEIINDISNIDNNYFIEHPEFIADFKLFLSTDSLKRKKNGLEYFNNTIDNNIINDCEHEWIDDSIDIDCENSMNITYCKKCETSKK